MKPLTKLETVIREYYLDYINNFLTVEKFAEHNQLTDMQAVRILEIGRDLHAEYVELVNVK